MHVNHTPPEPPGKPCIRDMHELLRDHLPPAVVIKVLPLEELERRCHEVAAEHQRFREEAPLVLQGEATRRHRLRGLRVALAATQHQVA
jgi:hypothetical protein